MNVPIATPITIAAPPSSAIRIPRHIIGRREKRALTTPTIKSEATERLTDTMSAVPEVKIMYGISGMRDASTQEMNMKIAAVIEWRLLTVDLLIYSLADFSVRKSPIAIENA